MRKRLQLDSIAARLTWMNLLVSAVALLLACLAFLAYDQITFRNSVVRNLSAQAEIVGDATVSAVTFNDPDVAGQTLRAISNTANVRAGAIVLPSGSPFAVYQRTGNDRITSFPPLTAGSTEQFWHRGANILVARRIMFQGKETSTVYILADTGELSARLWRYLLIVFVVLAVSMFVALLASQHFRRALAEPIERVARVARDISRHKNFALRADAADTTRELQVLISSFNDMLAEIQTRDLALQDLAAESHATLQSIPQLVWTTDPSGRVTFFNQRWFDYTGMAQNQNFGLWHTYVHPQDEKTAVDAWQKSVATGEEYRVEYRLRRQDGTYRWHLAQGIPIRDESGQIQKWFGTCTDIHDRKLTESALVQAEKLAVTGRMAATIAHEINNPLATITNVAHLIGTMSAVTDEQRELLAMLNEEVARVSHIVKSTLGLSRQTTTPAPIDASELVESVFTLFQRRFHSKNVLVTKRYDTSERVSVVPSELRQVVSNLFSNALDVMPDHGQLLIAVRSSFDWCHPDRHGVRITISDSGPGIPLDARQHLFEAFFTTKAEMGTGLGLWVSKSIVEKHGGSLRFRSRTVGPRRGTTFSIFLPQHATQQTSSQVA